MTALPGSWTVQVSRSTGKTYWFNTRTGTSVYEMPPDVAEWERAGRPALPWPRPHAVVDVGAARAAGARDAAPTASAHSSAATGGPAHDRDHADVGTRMPDGPAADHPAGLFSANPVVFRAAVEAICERMDLGRGAVGGGGGSGSSGGVPLTCYTFPVCDKERRTIIHDLADEFSLKSASAVDEGVGEKFVMVYVPGHAPPLVQQAEAEEAELEAQAAALRAAEAEATRRAREEAAATGAARRRRGGTGGHAGSTAAAAAAAPVPLKPLFKVRDKRSVAEIQEELKAKRARLVRDAEGDADDGGAHDGHPGAAT